MKLRLIVLLSIFTIAPCMASDLIERTNSAAAPNATLMQNLKRGASIKSNNQTYQYLPEVRAVLRKSDSEDIQQLLQNVGVATSQHIETKGNYVVYRGMQSTTAQIDNMQSNGSFPAVMNENTKVIGILPGTIEVKPRSMSDVAGLASAFGLSVVREFSHLKVVYYQVKPGQDILGISAALAADSRVLSAELEVIEYLQEAN